MSLPPGSIFAGYQIVRRLGAGGMGAVYLARHPRLPRWDAVKVLTPIGGDGGEFRARFAREAELAARLDHPNVVAVLDRGAEGESLWIAMQYIEGFDVSALIAQGPQALPPQRAVYILGEVAKGLDEAHRLGLLHRDVKPANILIQPVEGRPDRVYIADFGIARAAGDAMTALTAAGSVLATLAYAAPEQIDGAAMDHRVDVYALGCTLHHMLTGSPPFPRDMPAAVMHAHLAEPPPRPTASNPALPVAFDNVIARAMAKHPQDRFGSCGELAQAAADALRGAPVEAPKVRRRVSRAAVIGVAAIVLAVVLAVTAALVVTGSGSVTSDARPTTPSTVPTTKAAAGPWGAHTFVVDAFPRLLPATPTGTGHRGLRCAAVDSSHTRIPVEQPVQIARLECSGDDRPLRSLQIECNADRSRRSVDGLYGIDTPVGDQMWSRPPASGLVRWYSRSLGDRSIGFLAVRFDNPQQYYCTLTALGQSAQALYDEWWSDAPV